MPDRLSRAREDLGAFARMVERPLTSWQLAALTLAARTTVIRAGRQCGKSRALAVLAVWWAFTRPRSIVLVVSAGEGASLRVLREIRDIVTGSDLLSGSVVDELAAVVRLSNGSEIRSAPPSERAIRGQRVNLLLGDEVAIIDDDVILGAALATTLAQEDARIVLASSPRGARGAFFEAWQRGASGSDPSTAVFRWRTEDAHWISAEARAALRQGLPEQLARAEIDGEFLDDGGAGFRVIEDRWIDEAVKRDLPGNGPLGLRDRPGGGALRLGVDVARSGSDETVGVQVRGGRVRVAFSGRGWDTMRTADLVVRAVLEDPHADPEAFAAVDETGLGAGVVDRARQLGAPIRGFVSAARARQPQRFANVRAESYFRLADALRDGLLDIDPGHRALVAQLRDVRWTTDRLGRILIESKDALRLRGIASPDHADALTMALWLDEGWRPREVLTEEDRAARDLEAALAAHDRAMAVQEARWKWVHPKSWKGGSVMGPDLMNERF